MKIIEGTKQAEKLLKKLADDGDLVDVYSESFLDRQPSRKDYPYADFNKEDFEHLLEGYENNPEREIKPLNHLLFIHVDHYKKDVRKALVKIYRPLKDLIDNGKHNPDFLLINLYTQQVLCIGLGRKNGLFIFDAETGESVNAFGLIDGESTSGFIGGKDTGYMEKFTEHDIYGAVFSLINALDTLGTTMFRNDSIVYNIDQIELALASGPNEHGEYHLQHEWVNVDEVEGLTKDELLSMIEEIEDYDAKEDESMRIIKIFFPQCERGELNTGDY